MTIVEGQIEPLNKLKESLSRSGITRFNSIGEINRFLRDYESEKKQLPSHIESVLEAEIQDMQSTLISHQQIYDELKTSTRNEIKQQIHKFEAEIKLASDRSNRSIFYRAFYSLKITFLSRRMSSLANNLESILRGGPGKSDSGISGFRA